MWVSESIIHLDQNALELMKIGSENKILCKSHFFTFWVGCLLKSEFAISEEN
jgi:hypothetical protein